MIDTAAFTRSTTKVTTKLPSGQVVIFSSTHYVKRVVTKLTREKSPERLAVELLREGEMCSL
jgi:ribosomal protein L34E